LKIYKNLLKNNGFLLNADNFSVFSKIISDFAGFYFTNRKSDVFFQISSYQSTCAADIMRIGGMNHPAFLFGKPDMSGPERRVRNPAKFRLSAPTAEICTIRRRHL